MNKIFKSLLVLTAGIFAVACNLDQVNELYVPENDEPNMLYAVYNALELEAALQEVAIPITRAKADKELTVDLALLLPEGITASGTAGETGDDGLTPYKSSVTFAAGSSSADVVLNVSAMEVGNQYTIGETCVIALLLGYAYLVFKGVIKWYVPAAFVATVFVLYLVTTGNVTYSLAHVLAGGLLFGAIFMATDYVTTPLSNLGKVVFCIGCGVLTFALRTGFIGAFPEGVSISILFMNMLTPLIEKWTNPKTLGGVR